jgi:hypothetical protein
MVLLRLRRWAALGRPREILLAVLRGLGVVLAGFLAAVVVFFLAAWLGLIW